jgi:acyl transferase domain-containing protein/NAD(P)-dependent dehydrogenase (short-subunit alcohol dehydrogenase family)
MPPQSVPLAIVGIGCLFPKAVGPGAFWANIKHGIDCVGPVPPTHWSPADYFDADPRSPDMTYAARGAFLDPVEFNPLEFGISPVDLEATDTSQLLGLVAARQALNDAGYTPDRKFDKYRISVVLGVTGTLELVIPLGARLGHPKWRKAMAAAGVDKETTDRVVQEISDSYVPWQENSFPGLLGNVVAGRIANKLDLGGTNCVVDAACASSLSAIHLASLELAAGRCDVAVTGGVDTFNDIFMFMCFSKTPALSRTGDAKPFDADGDGTILGEGLGVIVLKRLADAEHDGDRIYAVLRAIGSSSDGKGNAVYAPSADGQMRALKNAYELADVSPATIELIEAHGTGTKVGDSVEATALTQVFREAQPEGKWCALGSVKSMVGHTKAAAGAAGLIKAALALYNKVLPPTIKVKRPVEPLQTGDSPLYVNTENRPWLPRPEHPRRAGMSAFGFGGSNFHAVLEEYGSKKPAPDWDGRVQIVALAGDSPAAIVQQLASWPIQESWAAFCNRAAATRASFDREATCRLLLVAHRDAGVEKLIAGAQKRLESEPAAATSWSTPDGAYFGRGQALGKLAVLFPGQGSQAVGMLRDLACTFPEMLEALTEANATCDKALRRKRLSDFIYPHAAFDLDGRSFQEQELRATDVAQPAIGAVSLGAWRVLERFGVRADVFAGHSYGELVALCAAGAFDSASLHMLSRERGRIMASFHGDDAGSMLAVHAPTTDIERVLRDEALPLVVANRNSPSQCVLSGRTDAIARAEAALRRNNVRCTRLPVAAAFHSPLVAGASGPFRNLLEQVEFRPKRAPVFANRNGQMYPDDANDSRTWLAEQLAQPVEFVEQIRNMALSGVRTFLEVGPGTVLARLTEATLKTEPTAAEWDCIALDATCGKKPGMLDLAHALARLAARGHSIDLDRWEEGQTYPVTVVRPGLTVPISGANYVRPRPAGPAPSVNGRPQKKEIVDSGRSQRTLMSDTPASKPPDPPALSSALGITQQSLLAFQRMQEETARLHKQFLDNQQAALTTLQALVAQQHALLTGQQVPVAALPPISLPAPQPSVVADASRLAPASPVPPKPKQPQAEAKPSERPGTSTTATPPRPREPVTSAKPISIDASSVLLSVVAEKTGYPADMLGLDMALDADLGIDSIKRVEILSALQEKIPDAPAVKPEHLGTIHTLRDIVNFLGEPAAATPAPAATPPPTPTNGPDVADTLLAVVAEKTGYPADMLGLDMALDADLGIDSIKRVEILSALQEKIPDAPAVKPEHLGTLHTLRDIASFLGSANGPPITPKAEDPRPFESALTLGSDESERVSVSAPVVEVVEGPVPGRVARSVIRPAPIDLSLSRPRVAVDKFAPVWIIADPSRFASRVSQQFESAGCRPQVIAWNDSPFVYETVGLAGLVLIAPDDPPLDDLPHRAFRWLKRASPSLSDPARVGGSFFATVTKLDGMFGFGALDPSRDPIPGAFAGLSKTASREWPHVDCKAIDIDPQWLKNAAHDLVDEILTAGPLEVGMVASGRITLELQEAPALANSEGLAQGDLVIVTGGARGVTAEALFPLVRAKRPRLVLFGRTAMADDEPDWLAQLSDEAAMKQAIAAHMSGPATPRAIGDEYRRVLAQREIRRNLVRLRQAGASVEYFNVDVLDAPAIANAVADVRRRLGPIAAIVHGAGVLADRKIADLSEEQFRIVFQTKVVGLKNLLVATETDPLKAIVLFSSSTGRFGRSGQLAYAAANEALNKIAQHLNRVRPTCRTVAINWGPWEGGMVTPALAKVFEKEGIGLVSYVDGGETLLRELAAKDGAAEVVILAQPSAAKEDLPAADLQPVFEREVRLSDHPVLRSHVIGDRSVVPLVLHLEWMAHAAMHGLPGLKFQGFDELRIFQGIQVSENSPASLKVLSGKATKRDGTFVVPVEISGRKKGRDVPHSRSRILLGERLPDEPPHFAPPSVRPFGYSLDEIYETMLFHGPDLRALERIDGMNDAGAIAFARTSPPPSAWMDEPVRGAWLADPLALDAALQLLIVWIQQRRQAGSLPCFVGSYRQYRRSFPADGVLVTARITYDAGSTVRADMEFMDADGRIVARMNDVEYVIDVALNESFRKARSAMAIGIPT